MKYPLSQGTFEELAQTQTFSSSFLEKTEIQVGAEQSLLLFTLQRRSSFRTFLIQHCCVVSLEPKKFRMIILCVRETPCDVYIMYQVSHYVGVLDNPHSFVEFLEHVL